MGYRFTAATATTNHFHLADYVRLVHYDRREVPPGAEPPASEPLSGDDDRDSDAGEGEGSDLESCASDASAEPAPKAASPAPGPVRRFNMNRRYRCSPWADEQPSANIIAPGAGPPPGLDGPTSTLADAPPPAPIPTLASARPDAAAPAARTPITTPPPLPRAAGRPPPALTAAAPEAPASPRPQSAAAGHGARRQRTAVVLSDRPQTAPQAPTTDDPVLRQLMQSLNNTMRLPTRARSRLSGGAGAPKIDRPPPTSAWCGWSGPRPQTSDTADFPGGARPHPCNDAPVPHIDRPESRGRPASRAGRPVSRDGRPVSRDGRPVSRDGRPVSRDGRPVSRDGRPVSRDGRPASALRSRSGRPESCVSLPHSRRSLESRSSRPPSRSSLPATRARTPAAAEPDPTAPDHPGAAAPQRRAAVRREARRVPFAEHIPNVLVVSPSPSSVADAAVHDDAASVLTSSSQQEPAVWDDDEEDDLEAFLMDAIEGGALCLVAPCCTLVLSPPLPCPLPPAVWALLQVSTVNFIPPEAAELLRQQGLAPPTSQQANAMLVAMRHKPEAIVPSKLKTALNEQPWEPKPSGNGQKLRVSAENYEPEGSQQRSTSGQDRP